MTDITASLPKSLWTSSPSFSVYILLFNKWPLVDSARVKALIKPPWLDRKELSKVYFPFELYQSFIDGKLPVRFIHLLKLGYYQVQESESCRIWRNRSLDIALGKNCRAKSRICAPTSQSSQLHETSSFI